MDCREARRRFNDSLDGALDRRGAERLQRHLGSCPACRAEYDLLLSMDHELGEMIAEKAPARLLPSVMDRLERRLAWNRRVNTVSWAAAASALFIALGGSLGHRWLQRVVEFAGRIEEAAVSIFGEGPPGALDVTLSSAFSLAGVLFLILYTRKVFRENGGEEIASVAAVRE